MEYPILVYKTPGPHVRLGIKHQWRGCESAEQLEELKALGWAVSLWDDVEDTSGPTLAELRQKAKELGIKGAHLMKAETLAEKIEAAL